MSTTTTSSTSPSNNSPDWPANAIPKKWVEVLFEKMTSVYGSRFADLWRGADVEVTKRVWGIELAKLSSQQMKAGSDNITQLVKSPTLPEFIAHCKQARTEQAAHTALKIEQATRASDETIEANLPRIKRAAAHSMNRSAGSVAWAFEFVETGKSRNGLSLPPEVLRSAEDAVLSDTGARAANSSDKFAAVRRSVINKRNGVPA